MIKGLIFTIALFGSALAAFADTVFDTSLVSWTKTQDVAETTVTQWSLVGVDGIGLYRLDLVHTTQETLHPTYYIVRRPCGDGGLAWQRILPSNKLGLGLDCYGNIPGYSLLATKAQHVAALPDEARALLQK